MARDGAGRTGQRGGRRTRAAACERERARRGIGAQALRRAHIERIGKGGHEGVTAVEVACKLRFLVFYHDDGTFRGFGVLHGVVLSLDTGKKERKDGPGPGQGRPGEATTANSVLGHEGGGAQSALAYESDV